MEYVIGIILIIAVLLLHKTELDLIKKEREEDNE